jgi:hypothetical protein
MLARVLIETVQTGMEGKSAWPSFDLMRERGVGRDATGGVELTFFFMLANFWANDAAGP